MPWIADAAPFRGRYQACFGTAHGGLEHAAGEVRRCDAQAAQIDAVLVGRRAACRIEAVDGVVAETGCVVDDRVYAAADIDGVITSAADDRIGVIAAVERVVAVAAIEEVIAVIAVDRVVTRQAESWLSAPLPLMMLLPRVAAADHGVAVEFRFSIPAASV